MYEKNYRYPLSLDVPEKERGRFYAYFDDLIDDREKFIEQYIQTKDQSEKDSLEEEIEIVEDELNAMRKMAIIWNMEGQKDWEEVRKYKSKLPPFKQKDSYRIVYLWGEEYILTHLQSIVIRTLHEAYKKGIYKLHSKDINDHFPDNQHFYRLSKVFKEDQRVWKGLITFEKGKKGIYSLKDL